MLFIQSSKKLVDIICERRL